MSRADLTIVGLAGLTIVVLGAMYYTRALEPQSGTTPKGGALSPGASRQPHLSDSLPRSERDGSPAYRDAVHVDVRESNSACHRVPRDRFGARPTSRSLGGAVVVASWVDLLLRCRIPHGACWTHTRAHAHGSGFGVPSILSNCPRGIRIGSSHAAIPVREVRRGRHTHCGGGGTQLPRASDFGGRRELGLGF